MPLPDKTYLSEWHGEIVDHMPGEQEGETVLIVQVTRPERRGGRRVRVTLHRDQLLDLFDMDQQH